MRKQFVKTVEQLFTSDDRLMLLLGDIGVFGFRNAAEKYPGRILNLGILEGSMVSLAAGISKNGLIPIVHSIAPFIVERAFEQIKIDFGYQKLKGNLVTVGASYDYAALGATHHCPGDVCTLLNIPDIQIVVPGSSKEFDALFNESYSNEFCTYFRLSESENNFSCPVSFGKAHIVKTGSKGTVLVVGPLLEKTLAAVEDLNVSVIYYTTIRPFDSESLAYLLEINQKLMIVEPLYEGSLLPLISENNLIGGIKLKSISVPRKFITNYGKAAQHDESFGFSTEKIKEQAKVFFYEN
jgi:transketolase